MNSTTLIVVAVVILGLGGAAALEGKLLLDAHEKIGDMKAVIADQKAVIKQKEDDAKLSAQLDKLQLFVEGKLKDIGVKTSQGIDNATSDDLAARAAVDGVRQLRATRGSGPTTP